jgi:hypothetical protein
LGIESGSDFIPPLSHTHINTALKEAQSGVLI